MASAVNATAQEARLSIWVVLVRVRPRPFNASVASIPPAFLPGSHPASIAERAAQGCIRAHCAIHDWENRLLFVMAGLDPAMATAASRFSAGFREPIGAMSPPMIPKCLPQSNENGLAKIRHDVGTG